MFNCRKYLGMLTARPLWEVYYRLNDGHILINYFTKNLFSNRDFVTILPYSSGKEVKHSQYDYASIQGDRQVPRRSAVDYQPKQASLVLKEGERQGLCRGQLKIPMPDIR